jgi:hypothetical protein
MSVNPHATTALRVASLIGLGLATLVFAATYLAAAAAPGAGHDLVPLAVAGRLVSTQNSTSLYAHDPEFFNRVDDSAFRAAAAAIGFHGAPTPFVYPPVVGFAAAPVASIPFADLKRAWALIGLLALMGAVLLTYLVYLPGGLAPVPLALTFLALCVFEPALYGAWLGQTTPLIFALIAGSIAAERRGWHAFAGALLSLAAFIKITPIAIAAIWLWRGPRRAFAWCLIGLALLWGMSCAVAGVDLHAIYLGRVVEASQVSLAALNNHSLLAVMMRLGRDPATLDWRMLQPSLFARLIVAIAGVVATAFAIRYLGRVRRNDPDSWKPAAESLVLLLILLLPNIAWTHYFVLLLPAMATVLQRDGRRSLTGLLIVGAAWAACARPIVPPQSLLPAIGPHLLAAGPTWAALILFVAIIASTRR